MTVHEAGTPGAWTEAVEIIDILSCVRIAVVTKLDRLARLLPSAILIDATVVRMLLVPSRWQSSVTKAVNSKLVLAVTVRGNVQRHKFE